MTMTRILHNLEVVLFTDCSGRFMQVLEYYECEIEGENKHHKLDPFLTPHQK